MFVSFINLPGTKEVLAADQSSYSPFLVCLDNIGHNLAFDCHQIRLKSHQEYFPVKIFTYLGI